ncbi:MAG TPA: Ig-like domain-containing protein, partial [Thermoanaerobaculia bacterium]
MQPAVAPDGTLTYTLAPNAFGSTIVSVVAQDDAGASSAAQTFTISITGVNDAPSFVPGGNVSANEDAGAQSIGWATGISAGPSEAGQALAFNVSNDNNALFSVQPAISAGGVLTFTSAPNAFGSAIVTVSLSDNGGTANGGVDTSASITFTLTINAVNDPPAAAADAFDTIGNTLLQVSGSKTVADPAVFVTGSVLANDADIDSAGSLNAALVPASVTGGASVTMNADGTFTYLPAPGHAGATDSFQYTVSDGSASSTGTVTITLKGRVWYVRNNGPAGSGRSTNSFSTLSDAQALSVAGDTIYVYAGDGTTTGQNAGFVLKSGQRLIGQGVALTVPVSVNGGASPTVLLAAGAKAKVTNAAPIVSAANIGNIEVAGLDLSSSPQDGIRLTNVTNAAVSTVTIANNLGNGITGTNVNGFTLGSSTVTGNGDDAAADEAGIRFDNLTGSAAISNTTISGSIEDNVRVVNTGGVLDRITFTNVTVGANAAATGNDGVFLQASNSATFKVTVQNSTFTAARGDLFQFSVRDNAVTDLVFTNNALSNNHPNVVSGG